MMGQTLNKVKKLAALGLLSLGLAACQGGSLGDGLSGTGNKSLLGLPTLTPNPQGEVVGQGNVRVSLLLPRTAAGNGAVAAKQIYNGAMLAMQDFGSASLQLVIKDTNGNAAGAQAAANQAVQEGSSAILGPLFSSSVNSASAVTQPAGRPIIGFSTDTSVARRGVYLISYTPQDDTRAMMNFASAQDIKTLQVFLPNNAEGNIREAVIKETVEARGMRVNITKFEFSGPGIETAARAAAVWVQSADALYIPEGGQIPGVILASLERSGVSTKGKKILGSGKWESVKFDTPALDGAFYTGRDVSKFGEFATRYKSNFSEDASVLSAIGYDAVTLATTLVRSKGPQAFASETLEDQKGFAGINGIFRLRANGTSQRGLAVYQVTNGAGSIISPAPGSFTTGF
ncbi:MAG: penicillin-binding protein activator [Nitratireductor sp.]